MEPHTTEDVKFVEAVEPGEMTFFIATSRLNTSSVKNVHRALGQILENLRNYSASVRKSSETRQKRRYEM